MHRTGTVNWDTVRQFKKLCVNGMSSGKMKPENQCVDCTNIDAAVQLGQSDQGSAHGGVPHPMEVSRRHGHVADWFIHTCKPHTSTCSAHIHIHQHTHTDRSTYTRTNTHTHTHTHTHRATNTMNLNGLNPSQRISQTHQISYNTRKELYTEIQISTV